MAPRFDALNARDNKARIALAVAIAVLIAIFFVFDLGRYLELAYLQAQLADIQAFFNAHPFATAAVFFLIYVTVTALSLPSAALLTLLAGAIFGLLWGTLIVSFASTIGATLAFLAARFVLRDTVQRKFGQRLETINRGVEKDGAYYLFTLRLIPVFPFFVVNLVMGLTRMRTVTFYVVSQIGMLAGTLVYVNAGTQLAQIDSLGGILSPGVLGSLVLLGLFPLIARMMVTFIQKRRVLRGYHKPRRFDRNLVVIGAGAAGLVSSYIAATVNAKVTLVEAAKMGGDCLNHGCVPSKALIKSAKLARDMGRAERYGLDNTAPVFSFRQIMARIREVIRTIEPHDGVERYTGLGVEVLAGHARLIDPWTVDIRLNTGEVQRLTTRSIVIAAGSRPVVPPLPGIEDSGYVTSDTLWDAFSDLDAPPQRLVILGGGPVGCELAQSFARLGSNVTQVEMASRILMREDPEVSAHAQAALTEDGVTVLTGHEALRCQRDGQRKSITVRGQEGEKDIEFDELICAVGRTPWLEGYGLEELGIPVDQTGITDEYLQTLFPNIYAAGDVVGAYQFTHTAAHQAWYAAVNALFGGIKRFKVDYRVVPRTTFVDPEVACVGLNEQDATEQGVEYEVTRYGIDDLDRAITDSVAEGFVKVLTVPGKDRILGVTIVGAHAGELLAEYVLAMKHKLGLNAILGTIHAYPTLAEANKFAAGEWKRAHAPQRVLAWLGRYHAWRRG